ncbi:MAG: FAD:protein FMN transferase [Vicinamibacteria bacterium]
MTRSGVVAMALCLAGLRSGADAPVLEELRLAGRAQGTTYHVRAYRPGPAVPAAAEVERSVAEELDHIDRLMSTWRDDSEIERFNAAPANVAFPLSAENAQLLARSREIWRITDGAFDPGLGAVIRLWGFGGAAKRTTLPMAADVEAALRDSGIGHVTVKGTLASKDRPRVRIDLNGIAQGYTVDRVFELLQAAGYSRAMVEIGGEVRVGDPPPDERAWRVGIDSPDPAAEGSLVATLALTHAAVSTSGTYRSAFVVDGVEYSHILDPRDGRPIRNGMVLAAVVAPDATTTDGLDTALMVLGPEKSLALVATLPGVDCLLLARNGEALAEFRSPGLARWIVD